MSIKVLLLFEQLISIGILHKMIIITTLDKQGSIKMGNMFNIF